MTDQDDSELARIAKAAADERERIDREKEGQDTAATAKTPSGAPEQPPTPEIVADMPTVDKMPEWTRCNKIPADLSKQISMKYPELIEGFIHRGTKVVIGGASKSYKSWFLLHLAVCTAAGIPFFGRKTAKGLVVWINLEIPHEFALQRVKQVCAAMGIETPENLAVWTLRGRMRDFGGIAKTLRFRAEREKRESGQEIMMIILDPLYMGLAGRDENAAGDMSALMGELDELIIATGGTIIACHHFAKGNAADKEPQDRMSGSGVVARNADSILILTKHEEDRCYSVTSVLRNFAETADFVIEWDFPIFKIAEDLDPYALKRPQRQKRSPIDPARLLDYLPHEGLATEQWYPKVSDLISKSSFYNALKALSLAGHIAKDHSKKWRITE